LITGILIHIVVIQNIVLGNWQCPTIARDDLINLYDATDVRLTGLTKTNSKYSGYRWSTKYPGKNGQLAYNNVPVLRISGNVS